MTLPAPTYDLVMLLDPQSEEETRAKIVADARAAIEARGEFLRHDDWGDRAMTYPIDRRTDAEYHLLQFHAGTPELLGALDRSLRITDGILRFRIVKLKPGVPDAPNMLAQPAGVRRSESEPAGGGEHAGGSEPSGGVVVEAAVVVAGGPVEVAAEVEISEPSAQAAPATQAADAPAQAAEPQAEAAGAVAQVEEAATESAPAGASVEPAGASVEPAGESVEPAGEVNESA
jgi:small subunit ribosomal protein S6